MPPSSLPKNCSSILSSSSRSSLCKGTTTIRLAQPVRTFTASSRDETRQRRMMYSWLNGYGQALRDPIENSPNYLGLYNAKGELKRPVGQDAPNAAGKFNLKPFPRSDAFYSQQVTSESLRDVVWEKIMRQGLSVKEVSVELGIEMSRVGAIVRLKEVEKQWQKQGKRLAKPYSKAIMNMLPQTPYPHLSWSGQQQPHEPINDLPVHSATQQQIFHPTSESRQFTRRDAARVFADDLLPADLRVPHPELAEDERLRLAGMGAKDIAARAEARSKAAYEKKAAADERRRVREREATQTVPGVRWDFKFRDVSVDDVGADGRGLRGTGWRYGVPLSDRRKGQVKIPTKVA